VAGVEPVAWILGMVLKGGLEISKVILREREERERFEKEGRCISIVWKW